jgi:hypothetical protein
MMEGDDEFVRAKLHAKDDTPKPEPYDFKVPDWSKAVELQRRSCEIPGSTDQCVLLAAPIKPWIATSSSSKMTKMTAGSLRLVVDLETGLLPSVRTIQTIENDRGGCQSETLYLLKRFQLGTKLDPALFKLPSGDMREVKEFTRWNAGKIKKQLAGNAAPELSLTDIHGKQCR